MAGKVSQKPVYREYFRLFKKTFLLTSIIIFPCSVLADSLDECINKGIRSASPDTRVAEIKADCDNSLLSDSLPEDEYSDNGVVKERIKYDQDHVLEPFTLMAHKPNYLLFAAYNDKGYNSEYAQVIDPDNEWRDTEAQFQLSMKFPLLVNLLDDTFDIYAGYTNRSFWQIYGSDSSPFRETNHEPEIWVQFQPNWKLWGFTNTWNSFGVNHQSNGREEELSRSWNRVFAWITLEKGNLAMSVKPWYRVPEDLSDDDNPDITDYMGHGEISASYLYNKHVFSALSRNNLESGFSKGTVELSWSFPLGDWPYLKGYIHWHSGYGESLIDYNTYANTIGIGISLTDWL
ncbi:MAG: phospholipase A [Psychromonas sp.]